MQITILGLTIEVKVSYKTLAQRRDERERRAELRARMDEMSSKFRAWHAEHAKAPASH